MPDAPHLWIKVCGITTYAAIDAAARAGANAIGLVFARSPREVTLTVAARLKRHLKRRAELVAVMRHPAPSFARSVCEHLEPDWLQTDAEDLPTLSLPAGQRVLPVYRDQGAVTEPPARLLFEGRDSGTGTTCDWSSAGALATRTHLVLAGGLNAGNVASAIEQVRPFGIDVSSGVEHTRGVKDHDLIDEFVRTARNAAAELNA